MFATPRVAAGTAVSWLRRLRLIQPEHRRHQVHEQEESARATGACVGYRVGSGSRGLRFRTPAKGYPCVHLGGLPADAHHLGNVVEVIGNIMTGNVFRYSQAVAIL
jgi:hypothetical protein